VHIFDSRRWIF